ncbi:uncharacterized protein VTP21DRAFT_8676 [Calcarisporiella thermophila]|uniref:uncharacterized protein n=1 Tax=Calcarisporiella thermophila TaxID=911321 RepID=UPI0037445C77
MIPSPLTRIHALPQFRLAYTCAAYSILFRSFASKSIASKKTSSLSKSALSSDSTSPSSTTDTRDSTESNRRSLTYRAARNFEFEVVEAFRRLGIDSRRSGGTNDRGIDFRGRWTLTHPPTSIPVVGQCKWSRTRSIGPAHIRELAGTVASESPGTLGLLVAHKHGFTRMATSAFTTSAVPLALAIVEGGRCKSLVWNIAAEKELRLAEWCVSALYAEDGKVSEVVLSWQG